jgi:3-hydroxyisobutyrate dehydrogenase-like beta-hydroxyacid dehydrogenase
VSRKIAIIGLGEAGQAFATGWALPAGIASAWDLKFLSPSAFAAIAAKTNVRFASSSADAVADADFIFTLVPTDQTLAAAEDGGPHLKPSAIWLDGSSSSPGRKREAARLIESGAGRYIDMAIMAPVYPRLHKTPVLLAGDVALSAVTQLRELGMEVDFAGADIGAASAIKMIRSVHVKGLEALTAECLLAARKAGVEEQVLSSLKRSDPNNDWRARGSYNLERMSEHGLRRAAEMREVVATLDELGIPSRISAATVDWQDQLGKLREASDEGDLIKQLDAILRRLA